MSPDRTLKGIREIENGPFFYAVQASPNAIMITDREGNVEFVNLQFTALTGYAAQEIVGQNARILKADCTDPKVFSNLWSTITKGEVWRGEFLNRNKSGATYWERAAISGFRDDTGEMTHYIAIKENITEEKRLQAERETLISDLQTALQEVKALSGLLPICASCKSIRNDRGYWHSIETYIEAHSKATFSHGICPECIQKLYPEIAAEMGVKKAIVPA